MHCHGKTTELSKLQLPPIPVQLDQLWGMPQGTGLCHRVLGCGGIASSPTEQDADGARCSCDM